MNCPNCTYDMPAALGQCALADAAGRGCSAVAQAFESKVATAQAVIGLRLEVAQLLVK